MKFTCCSPRIFGHRIFVESIEGSSQGKGIDYIKDEFETEVWIGNLVHIIISNEIGFIKYKQMEKLIQPLDKGYD